MVREAHPFSLVASSLVTPLLTLYFQDWKTYQELRIFPKLEVICFLVPTSSPERMSSIKTCPDLVGAGFRGLWPVQLL